MTDQQTIEQSIISKYIIVCVHGVSLEIPCQKCVYQVGNRRLLHIPFTTVTDGGKYAD